MPMLQWMLLMMIDFEAWVAVTMTTQWVLHPQLLQCLPLPNIKTKMMMETRTRIDLQIASDLENM